MPSVKKDLPLEANLFWFDEGMCPERCSGGMKVSLICKNKKDLAEKRGLPFCMPEGYPADSSMEAAFDRKNGARLEQEDD